jgi:hypothetical protein
MMRAATLVWIALAGVIGTGLFQLKHVVQEMDDELARLNRQIAAEHRNIHVLRAEWSHHNQPQRLQLFVQRHLDLEPMKPAQLARLGDLPRRAAGATPETRPAPAQSSAPTAAHRVPAAQRVAPLRAEAPVGATRTAPVAATSLVGAR